VSTLLARWRYPSLSIHGVQGAFDGAGAKTVIPRKVIGKFSIRIVPDQDPLDIEQKVVTFIEERFKLRNSPNKLK
jgi:acetylornithine deacetylase/succinyl-diaminopimelate desuccinylase-like protein